MIEREAAIERKLVELVERQGGYCPKWTSPGNAGVPDRICLLPGGVIIFVELKRPSGGVTSSRQKGWAKRLTRLGFKHYFIKDEQGLALLAEEHGWVL